MEDLLLKVGSQAASFAIRSGLGYASKFAFVQVSKFIQVVVATRLKLMAGRSRCSHPGAGENEEEAGE